MRLRDGLKALRTVLRQKRDLHEALELFEERDQIRAVSTFGKASPRGAVSVAWPFVITGGEILFGHDHKTSALNPSAHDCVIRRRLGKAPLTFPVRPA